MEIATESGVALVVSDDRADARCLMVLTHGAGGGADSPDLLAARRAGLESGAVVARVIQPWRAAGARVPGSVPRQDQAWLQVIAALRETRPGVPLIQGGRSNGARLACRTARSAGAVGVIALAFPLHPPGRAGDPGRSRAGELRDAGVPVLVVNGERDPFGIPAPEDASRLVVLPDEAHALSRHPERVEVAVRDWLGELLSGGPDSALPGLVSRSGSGPWAGAGRWCHRLGGAPRCPRR